MHSMIDIGKELSEKTTKNTEILTEFKQNAAEQKKEQQIKEFLNSVYVSTEVYTDWKATSYTRRKKVKCETAKRETS